MKPLNIISHVPQTGVPQDAPQQMQPQPQHAQPAFNPSGQKYQTHTGAGRFAKYMQENGKSAQGTQHPVGPQFQGTPDMSDMRFARAPVHGDPGHAWGIAGATANNYTHPNDVVGKSNWHSGIGMPVAQVHRSSDFNKGWDNRTNHRPYKPIVPKSYPNYGTQSAASVASTEYAKQLAERLIGDDHRVDLSQLPHILNELKHDQTLSVHHRWQVKQKLEELHFDPGLVAGINSICERPGKSLRGPAADLVRATLNPPADQTHLGKGHARKAAVMAMFGNLRQGGSGSCFATSPAICIHEDSSRTVISNMKEMLEENSMRMKTETGVVQVPLNKRTSWAAAEVKHYVGGDGTCYGNASQGGVAPFKLHQTPGMQGALTALGIQEDQMEGAVATALWQMGLSANQTYSISCKQIVQHLAHNPPPGSFVNAASPNQKIATALNAFSGKEDVRLLRAWEYTLATHADSYSNNLTIRQIGFAALYGNPNRPDMQSLSGRNGAYQQFLTFGGHYHNADVGFLSQELFNDVDKIIQQRFFMNYDANLKQDAVSADGVSNRGGFVMYDRTPPNDPAKWKRIDDAATFQQAMASAFEQAANSTLQRTYARPGFDRNALGALTENLKQNILADGFPEQVSMNFNGLNPNMHHQKEPWKQGRGAYGVPIMEHYGSRVVHTRELGRATSPTYGPGAAPGQAEQGGGDATEVMKFICEGMAMMAPELHDKARASSRSIAGGPPTVRNFKTPIMNGVHAFSAMPMQMADAWANGRTTPEAWVENALKEPARRHVDDTRTQPPLLSVLRSVCDQVGATDAQFQIMYQRVTQGRRLRSSQEPYSLKSIHEELKAFSKVTVDPARTLEIGEAALLNAAPVPARIFADTNWPDTAGTGNPTFIGALYNPFKHKVELNCMDMHQGNRTPVQENWNGGLWSLGTPVAAPAVAPPMAAPAA
jgi:hypothetical protein